MGDGHFLVTILVLLNLLKLLSLWRSNRDSGRVALRARTLIGGGAISEIPEKGGTRVAGLFPYNSYSEDAFLRTVHFCVKNEICTSVAAACKDIAGSDCGELPLCVIPASSCSEQNGSIPSSASQHPVSSASPVPQIV